MGCTWAFALLSASCRLALPADWQLQDNAQEFLGNVALQIIEGNPDEWLVLIANWDLSNAWSS
jgi:hypothetical protein